MFDEVCLRTCLFAFVSKCHWALLRSTRRSLSYICLAFLSDLFCNLCCLRWKMTEALRSSLKLESSCQMALSCSPIDPGICDEVNQVRLVQLPLGPYRMGQNAAHDILA